MLRSSTRVLVVLLCGAAAAAAQTCSSAAAPCVASIVAPQTSRPIFDATAVPGTLRKSVEEVLLTFSVTDPSGRAVRDLNPGDVTVLADDQPVPVPEYFRNAETALRIGVLVDGSDSVADEFDFERQAAAQVLRHLMRPDFDEGFVIGFGAKWKLLQPLTRDSEQMISAMHPVDDPWVSSVYDAIVAACSGEMVRPARSEIRRAIILLSDGQDSDSAALLSDAVAVAQKFDVTIYALTRKGRHWDGRGERNLRELTARTGGRAYILTGPKQVLTVFHEIEEELRSSYTVAFTPLNARDGQLHSLQVVLRDSKLKVHGRLGYFAPQP